jgi:hypothetical protein
MPSYRSAPHGDRVLDDITTELATNMKPKKKAILFAAWINLLSGNSVVLTAAAGEVAPTLSPTFSPCPPSRAQQFGRDPDS